MEDWANILLLSGEGGLGAVQGEGRVEQLDRAARQLADLADLPTTESDLLQLARAAQIIAKHLLQQQVHFEAKHIAMEDKLKDYACELEERKETLELQQQCFKEIDIENFQKCCFCTKIFTSQSFLLAHLNRRHKSVWCDINNKQVKKEKKQMQTNSKSETIKFEKETQTEFFDNEDNQNNNEEDKSENFDNSVLLVSAHRHRSDSLPNIADNLICSQATTKMSRSSSLKRSPSKPKFMSSFRKKISKGFRHINPK